MFDNTNLTVLLLLWNSWRIFVAGASVVRGKGQAASVTLLTTTNKPVANVATTTTKNIYPEDARGDAVNPESAVTEVATAATSTDRTAWL